MKTLGLSSSKIDSEQYTPLTSVRRELFSPALLRPDFNPSGNRAPIRLFGSQVLTGFRFGEVNLDCPTSKTGRCYSCDCPGYQKSKDVNWCTCKHHWNRHA